MAKIKLLTPEEEEHRLKLQEELEAKFPKGAHVRIVKKSKTYNPKIDNVGWEGLVEFTKGDWVYISAYWDGKIGMRGGGRVDINCLEVIEADPKHTKPPFFPPLLTWSSDDE